MKGKELNVWVGGICMILLMLIILGMALFPSYCAHAQIINPGETFNYSGSVKCNNCPAPAPCPTCPPPVVCPTPAPIPIPTPTQPPATARTLTIIGTTYYWAGNRTSASSTQLAGVNKLRSYADYVFTFWEYSAASNWCPYIMSNSTVKGCGAYDNWGYMRMDKPLYTKAAKQWQLKTSNGVLTVNRWVTVEGALDWGNPAYVKFFIDYYENPPVSVGEWIDGRAVRKWNARFLDNFVIRTISNNAWNNTPVNPRTGLNMTNEEREADVLRGMQTMRTHADTTGLVYVANVWSDVMTSYFSRLIYSQLMNLVDYALFEILVVNNNMQPDTEAGWLARVKVFQAIAKNNKAVPVGTTEYGDFWYNLATVLLACEPGKCAIWQQPLMTDDQIQKTSTLQLGKPLSDFTKSGCYIRPWTNGLVIANPTEASCSIPLAESYRDLETGSTVSGSIAVASKRGKVLVK